jgi:hypothetical protein
MKAWYIVSNSSAGQSRAASLVESVLALLQEKSVQHTVFETQSEGDGMRIGQVISKETQAGEDPVTIAVIGGDGTLHELINGLAESKVSVPVHFVIVPSGTANAVYHSLYPETAADLENYDRLLAVKAALAEKSPIPFSVLRVKSGDKMLYSHVVTSTALHAHILETASLPEWRKTYPGTERFRKAAEKHFGTLYKASLNLKALPSYGVQKWSSKTSSWEKVSDKDLQIEADFTYFISALVDRLEATFLITPQSSARTRPAEAVDILLVRAKDHVDNSARLLQILNAEFQEGKHLELTGPSVGRDELKSEGDGDHVVEYYRASGFEWSPVSFPNIITSFRLTLSTQLDDNAKLVCIDGTTLWLDQGKTLTCEVCDPSTLGFRVYA